MNEERIELAVKILKKKLKRNFRYNNITYGMKDSASNIHTNACGLLAFDSKTEIEQYWLPDGRLEIKYLNKYSYEAVGEWLGIPSDDATKLFIGTFRLYKDDIEIIDVTCKHVIKVLRYYLKHKKVPDENTM